MIANLAAIDPKIHAPTAEQLANLDIGLSRPDSVTPLFRRRDEMAAQELGAEVTTLGWDTTYVLRVSDVNKVLEKSPDSPKEFQIEVDPSARYGVEGTFGPWQIGIGGSGGIVFLAIPIPTGKMTTGDNEYSMDGCTAYISVKLKYIPQLQSKGRRLPHKALSAAVMNEIEQVDDLVTDASDRTPIDPAVVVQNLVFAGTPPAAYVRALMIGAMQEWFTQNIVKFAYVFSSIAINRKVKDGQFQWLQPTYTGYGYFDGKDPESAFFGVLCMTDDRSPTGLSFQIGPGSIPSGSRAGFNISMERYMEKAIFPGLPKAFPHATLSSFTLKANNTVIENTEKIECDKVKVGAIWYTPYIHDFVLQVVGDEIQIYSRTVTEISPGIRSIVESTTYQTIVVVTKEDGSQTLDFKETQPPRTNSYIDKDEWIDIIEIIVSIAGAIATVVAGTIIKGVVKIIMACVIIAIVFSLAAATPELIAKVAGGGAAAALPPISLLILNATSPVEWPGSAEFTLDSAVLNGAFQLGGNPHITA